MGFRQLAATVAMVLFCAYGALAEEGKTGAGPEARKVYARVNGVELLRIHFRQAMSELMPAAVFHGGMAQEKEAKYRDQAIERMIEREILYQEALRAGMKTPEKWLEQEKEKNVKRLGGKEGFARALAKEGITEKEFEEFLSSKYLADEFVKAQIEEKSMVSDGEAEKYYEENRKMFLRPEARKIKVITITVPANATEEEWKEKQEQILDVLEKARKGEDFGQLAWDFSTDPYKYKSGDYGLVHRGTIEPVVEDEAFRLPVGGISDPVRSIYGWHIIKVEEEVKQQQLSFDEAKQRIKKDLSAKRAKELREALIRRLKEEAKIEIY